MLHGSNSVVGDVGIQGTWKTDKNGNLVFDVDVTWNDIIDPAGDVYLLDAIMAFYFGKTGNPKDYNIHITYNDRFVIPASCAAGGNAAPAGGRLR